MPTKEELFLNNAKIQQFIVQFACRIPVRKELNLGEKRALESVLKGLDSGVFQLFDEPLQKNPSCLFQVLHQLPVGATAVTLPSFIFLNDSFSFLFPIKMFGNPIRGIGSIDASDMNTKMLDWILKVQGAINTLHCQRTGKIYELVIGPFSQAEKSSMFKSLFSIDLDSVGELMLTFANYHKINSDIFNIQTTIRYLQAKLEDDFFVNMRIDINNRNLANSMEPRDIKKVWEFADSIIDTHLKNTFII